MQLHRLSLLQISNFINFLLTTLPSNYSYLHSGRPGLSANTFQPPTLSELRENSCSSSQQQLHNESNCHQQQLPNSEPVSPNRSNLPFGSMMGQPDKFSTIKRSYRSPFRRPSGGSTSSEMAFVSTGKQKHISQNYLKQNRLKDHLRL